MRLLAVALVVLGFVALVQGGFGFNRQTTILDMGGVKAIATERRDIPMVPVVGAIALLAGVLMLVKRRPQHA